MKCDCRICDRRSHDRLDLDTDTGIVEWLKSWIPHADLEVDRAVGIVGLGFDGEVNAVRNVCDKPAGELPPAAAGGLVIHLVLGALFGWALYRTGRVTVATAPTTA